MKTALMSILRPSGRVPVRHVADSARDLHDEVPPELAARVQKPIVRGLIALIVFGCGSIAWASVAQIAGAIVAAGVVRVEENRKTVKTLSGGIVRDIFVREGDVVTEGQVLIRMDEELPRAQVDVLRSTSDNFLMQRARLEAERDGSDTVTTPDELAHRSGEPAVIALIRDQFALFDTRRISLASEMSVLGKRMDQYDTRIKGLEATIGSLERQQSLIKDELDGVEYLFQKNYVPKPRLLALQRAAAEIEGNRGTQISEVTRARESAIETQLQMTAIKRRRDTEVAEAYRDVQAKLSETQPRLRAAMEALKQVEIKSPVDGYVLNLTQFTRNGIAAPGERMMDVVPANTPLVVEARIKPDESYEVVRGMPARIQLSTHEARSLPMIEATVVKVSADRIQDQKTGEPYFTADVRISADTLASLPGDVRIYPGMSATAMIGTGERSIMAYLLSPVRDSLRGALRER